MEPIIIFFIISAVLILGGIFMFLVISEIKTRRHNLILWTIATSLPNATIKEDQRVPYQFRIETDKVVYLVKLVVIGPQNELIITNPDFWCINSDPKSWNRSSSPKLVHGVKDFRTWIESSNKKIFRLALIFPGCRNITLYKNESDVEVVHPETDVFGVWIVQFDFLKDFFAKVEKN